MLLQKKIFTTLSIISLAFTLQAKEIYTIDDLIIKSLESSPDVQISQLEYEASQKRYDTAFAGYLPKVDLHSAAGLVHQSKTLTSPQDIDDTLITGKLTLKQIIYDFGKTGGSADEQFHRSKSFEMQNMQSISDKIRDVKYAYYTLLKAIALIDVQKENVKLNEAQFYRSKKYFEAGIRTKIDISDAEVRLIQARLDLKKAEYELKLAYAELDSVVGFSSLDDSYSVYAKELDLQNLYESLSDYPLQLKESILYAYAHRYEIKREEALINVAKSQQNAITSQYYPAFYFNSNYTYQSAQDDFQELIPETQWSANLNLDWNLYQGGATSARKQEGIIQQNISNERLLRTKLEIKKMSTNAYINVNRSKDTVALAQNLLRVSNEKFEQASKRYEHGLSDYIELQEARQGYINAKSTLVIDYYDYYIAVAALDNAIGK